MSLIKVCPLPSIGDILRLYRVRALKKLSQNFLLDMKLNNKIVRAAGTIENAEVCEIGPGPGGITRAILDKGPRRVIVIEKDERFKPILESLAQSSYAVFDAIYGDILRYNMSRSFSKYLEKDWDDDVPSIQLIGNLPFNVATPLIIRWLKDISLKRNAWVYGRVPMTLTFQDEVARRIVAPPNSKFRSRLSIMCQTWCDPHHKFTIPGRAFVPKPDVDVGVVHFIPLKEPGIALPFEVIEKVVRTIFSCRQKYLKNTLRHLFPEKMADDMVREMLYLTKLHPHRKSFQLTNENWRSICTAYKEICDSDPRIYSYDFRGNKYTREDDWMDQPPVWPLLQDVQNDQKLIEAS
ncbi:hypothetical protein RUM43_001793 [Polyplax serrata]|uniref:rRNA adenine N(6)-methyltransferase n=1 Tax=Polyplax serrata TaxID=468196 RepID=A0AAN8SGR8_POLSC